MRIHRQPDHFVAQPSKAGQALTQRVVELLYATSNGLVFWSPHHLDIAAELQLRVHQDMMKGIKAASAKGWMNLSGFVVECKPARRNDGTVGFKVTVVFDPTSLPHRRKTSRKRCPFGLN